jgi:hypothetical protein
LKDLARWLGVVLAGTLPWVRAADQPPQQFQVTNDHPGEFEVIYHRVTPTGIGAVAGGLIGVAVQRGMQSSDDDDMAKQVLASNPGLACDQSLLTALKTKLQSSGNYVLDAAADKQDLIIEVDIQDCGLHLADSKALELSSYVNFTLRVRPPGGESWSEDIQMSGRSRHSFDEFAHQQGLATTEVTDVLTRAGVRAADKIIYKH